MRFTLSLPSQLVLFQSDGDLWDLPAPTLFDFQGPLKRVFLGKASDNCTANLQKCIYKGVL